MVISTLSVGGAERVISIMANHWAEKGWPVNLISFRDSSEKPFYDLHPGISQTGLSVSRISANPIQGLINNFGRLLVLRRALKKSAPQAIISFERKTNIMVLLANWGRKTPVIISERRGPGGSPQDTVSHRLNWWFWNRLRDRSYLKAWHLVVQTQPVQEFFAKQFGSRVSIIPNPVIPPNDVRTFPEDEGLPESTKTLLALGRLHQVKGYDLLLRAFATIAQKNPSWVLEIWGEGPARKELEDLRKDLDLVDRVQFPGITKNPYEKMRRTDLFVLSSRLEGFPNALLEAMANGLPVVSFDCPSGPREIIRDGVDGILLPPEDVNVLAETLDRLMGAPEERDRLAKKAPEVIERFGVEKVMRLWEAILDQV